MQLNALNWEKWNWNGWDRLFTWRNPPAKLLEEEIAPQAKFAIDFATIAPRIGWHLVKVTPLGENDFHLLVLVENRGFLPTNISNQAKKMKTVRPVCIELELPANVALRSGREKVEIEHLQGRSNKQELAYDACSPSDNLGKAEWVIHAPKGAMITVHAISGGGGTIHKQVILER